MNIDLGSPVLDIAIALSFIFFLLSVIASAVTEGIAAVANLRFKFLKRGLNGMLGDVELVERVLGHPLIRTGLVNKKGQRQSSEKERGPSYIAPGAFARVFRDEVNDAECLAADLVKQLGALGIDAENVAESDRKTVEKWFNDSMARVSGWYKRRSQYIALAVAVLVAVVLNANALRLGEFLEREPTVARSVAAQAEASAKAVEFDENRTAETQIKRAGEQAAGAYEQIEGLKVPLLWAHANVPQDAPAWLVAALGWFLTAVAISFGAPFWFDALGKLSNLRMAGKKPEAGAKATT